MMCAFQDVVFQWLTADSTPLNQTDAEDPEVSTCTSDLLNLVQLVLFIFLLSFKSSGSVGFLCLERISKAAFISTTKAVML